MTLVDLYDGLKENVSGYIRYLPQSREIVTRCPFCGDSIKHENKGHLYIGEKFGAFLYQCKRAECNASGYVGKHLIESLGIFDINLLCDIKKHNQSLAAGYIIKSINCNESSYSNPYDVYNFNNSRLKVKYMNKMKYLMSRFYKNSSELMELEDLDLSKYRIILSIQDFMNNFNVYEKMNPYFQNRIEEIEKDYVGFMNMNGSSISFRRIEQNCEASIRYMKVKIGDNMDIYSIKEKVDLSNNKLLTINVCEGAIDIINIKHRLTQMFDGNLENNVFLAVNGSDYRNKVEYFVKYCGLLNVKIRLFIDSDFNVKRLARQIKGSVMFDDCEIYQNSAGKDFSEDKLNIIRIYT